MDDIAKFYLDASFLALAYMCAWFIVSLLTKRNDVADIAWGGGFLLVTWFSFFWSKEYSIRSIVVSSMVTIWALRLSLHVYFRNRFKKEDARYEAWRLSWGRWFYVRSFFEVFMLQGVLFLIVVFPVVVNNLSGSTKFSLLDFFGIFVWLIGFLFEVVADNELKNFLKKRENRGKIIQTGLWRYSRHPNYFGEVTCWWGLFIMALSIPGGVMGIIGPLTITFLILKVSGIPMLEERMKLKPGFEDYAKKTSIFFPLPAKKN